jgi:hypothetical protein
MSNGGSLAVVHERVAVADRLAELGLNEGILREAVMVGAVARLNCTSNNPPTMRNIMAWGMTITGLRDRLLPTGEWRRCDAGCFSRVINDTLKVAICVSTGDEKTGHPGSDPRTKYPKGTFMADAIESNLSFSFMADVPNTTSEDEDKISVEHEGLSTYTLLISRMGKEVRCELSLPKAIDTDGRVHEWAERIILEPIQLDMEPDGPPENEAAVFDGAAILDVPVSRKG